MHLTSYVLVLLVTHPYVYSKMILYVLTTNCCSYHIFDFNLSLSNNILTTDVFELFKKIVKFREFEIFLIFFARKNFRESAFKEFFAELTFANLTKIRENRESLLPRKFVPLKYRNVL